MEEPTDTMDATVPVPTNGEDQELPGDGNIDEDSYLKVGIEKA